MKLLSAAEMKEMDRLAIQEYGIPGMVLMENAAIRTVEMISELLPDIASSQVIILVGKGNNGGDGLAIARHLTSMGARTLVFMMAEPAFLNGDAATNFAITSRICQEIHPLTRAPHLDKLLISILQADLIVDAIYGIGFQGQLSDFESQVVRMANWSSLPLVAVDIPSGVEADSGRVWGEAVRATCTVTFALPKIGLILEPGKDYAGTVSVADITIPRDLMESGSLKTNLITENMVAALIKRREAESHKGSYGHVLAVGGSPGMSGAITMTALAALRSGAGLVTAAVPASMCGLADSAAMEVMAVPLPETTGGAIGIEALPVLENLLGTVNVGAIGPGLSRYGEAATVMGQLLDKSAVPLVLDADGLNALEDQEQLLRHRQVPLVITPHPGEMSRLTGLGIDEIQSRRLETARRYAQEWGIIVVLKGNKTVVASPEGEVFVNVSGNAGMATGGSGDVLTGIIAGFLAQGLKALDASVAGVYLHGLAGDLAASELGMSALIAGDLIRFLPAAFKQLGR